jgi:hypothetical protein
MDVKKNETKIKGIKKIQNFRRRNIVGNYAKTRDTITSPRF